MPIAIDGMIVPGFGKATGVIAQLRHVLRPYFPQIDTCQNGTINVALKMPLQVRLPDIVTPPLRWHPGDPEKFGFTRVEIELSGEARHNAWILSPEHSPHRFNSYMAEILTEPLAGIEAGRQCKIHIDRFLPMIVI